MSTVGLTPRDANAHPTATTSSSSKSANAANAVKRRMSTGSGILAKAGGDVAGEPSKKKRRNVSFGGAHVRLFDKHTNDTNQTTNNHSRSEAEKENADAYDQQEQTMEFTQSHGAIFLTGVAEEPTTEPDQDDTVNQEDATNTSAEMDFTRSHVFNIIQTAGAEQTGDLAAFYKNAGDETKELAEKYRSVMAQGQDATGDIIEEEDEEEDEDDLISFKPMAAVASSRESEPADETMAFTRSYTAQLLVHQPIVAPLEVAPMSREEELGEPADETMNFTRSYTTNIVTAPAASPFLAPTQQQQQPQHQQTDDQDECTMDFTRSFTAAIITNHASTTPGTTGFLSPLKFPGSSPTKAAPPAHHQIAEEQEEQQEEDAGQAEVTMEFTRSFTSAIVAPAQLPQSTPQAQQQQQVEMYEEDEQPQVEDVTMEFTRSFTSAIVAPTVAPSAAAAPTVVVAAPAPVAASLPSLPHPRVSLAPKQPAIFTAAQLPIPSIAPRVQPTQVVPTQEQCERIRQEAGILGGEMVHAKAQVEALQLQHQQALEQARVIEAAAAAAAVAEAESVRVAALQAKERAMVLDGHLHAKAASKNAELAIQAADAEVKQLVGLLGFRPTYVNASGLQIVFGQGESEWKWTVGWDGQGAVTALPQVDLSCLLSGPDAAYLSFVYAQSIHTPLTHLLRAMTHRKHVAKALPYLTHLVHRLVTTRDELQAMRQAFTVATQPDGTMEVTVSRVDTLRQVIFRIADQTTNGGGLTLVDTIGPEIAEAEIEREWKKIQAEHQWNRITRLCHTIQAWMGPQ